MQIFSGAVLIWDYLYFEHTPGILPWILSPAPL